MYIWRINDAELWAHVISICSLHLQQRMARRAFCGWCARRWPSRIMRLRVIWMKNRFDTSWACYIVFRFRYKLQYISFRCVVKAPHTKTICSTFLKSVLHVKAKLNSFTPQVSMCVCRCASVCAKFIWMGKCAATNRISLARIYCR